MADKPVRSLADLIPDPQNARQHNPRNIGMIEEALREVGAARSIVINENGVVLAGNATIEAAAQVGIERVRVVDVDGEEIVAVRRRGLTPEQETRLALYDNRAGELATWNTEVLANLLDDDPAQVEGMFFGDELARILSAPRNGTGEYDGGGDDVPEPEVDEAREMFGHPDEEGELLKLIEVTIDDPRTQVAPGEVWRLGHHYLIIADVLRGHDQWVPVLSANPDALFAPYPGPFVPMTIIGQERVIVMVQPDRYIAGHIIDRYTEVYGPGEVRREADGR